jgi:AcrR family transcriptional regulator
MDDPKTPKGRKTRQRILDEALRLINERGYDRVTLNDICEASGVAIGSFYHYFASTQAILLEVLRIEGEELQKRLGEVEGLPPLEAVARILDYQLDYFEKKGREVVARIYATELLSRQGSSRLRPLVHLPGILDALFKEAERSGDLGPGLEPGRCSALILGLILGYSFEWIASGEKRSLKELALGHLVAELGRMAARPALS